MSANLLNPNQPNRGVGHTVIDTLPISRSNEESVLYHRRGFFIKYIYSFDTSTRHEQKIHQFTLNSQIQNLQILRDYKFYNNVISSQQLNFGTFCVLSPVFEQVERSQRCFNHQTHSPRLIPSDGESFFVQKHKREGLNGAKDCRLARKDRNNFGLDCGSQVVLATASKALIIRGSIHYDGESFSVE